MNDGCASAAVRGKTRKNAVREGRFDKKDERKEKRRTSSSCAAREEFIAASTPPKAESDRHGFNQKANVLKKACFRASRRAGEEAAKNFADLIRAGK